MQKFLLLLPFIVFSCNKKNVSSEIAVENALPQKTHQTIKKDTKDSVKSIDTLVRKNNPDITRMVEGSKIIRMINGNQIPISVDDEFTNDDQQLIIKIKDFNRKNISGEIVPQNPKMNIRFNQIKLADGNYDGPFGRELIYETKEKGEVWLLIGKSNMASGKAKGKFSISIR